RGKQFTSEEFSSLIGDFKDRGAQVTFAIGGPDGWSDEALKSANMKIALGNGMKVLMLQFLKGSWHYGELDAAKQFGDNFVMKQMGRGFVKVGGAETDPEDIRMVEQAWTE